MTYKFLQVYFFGGVAVRRDGFCIKISKIRGFREIFDQMHKTVCDATRNFAQISGGQVPQRGAGYFAGVPIP